MSDISTPKKENNSRNKRPLLLLVFALAFAGLPVWLAGSPPVAAQTTTVTIESVATTINGCETLDIFIRINDVEGLYGADVLLSFDPAILEVTALEKSEDFLRPPFFPVREQYDNTAGTIRLAWTQLNPTPPAAGSGNFARVTFRAKGAGSNSPLEFGFAQLAGLGGTPIPATPVDGSLSTTPPAATTASISKLNSTTARLSWTAVDGVANYNIYRDTYAYFTPTTPYHTTTALTFDDVDALGSVTTNNFYVIRAACANGFESEYGNNRIGEFDYPLVTGISPQRFNTIAMPLDSTSLISPFKASGLAGYVGTGVRQVLKWNAINQRYTTFLPGIDPPNTFIDFDLLVGGAYMLVVDNTPANVLNLVGDVPPLGSVNFSLLLGTTSRCSFNTISIPLNRVDITRASELASDIGGVVQVLTWNPSLQRYNTFLPGIDPPNTFVDFAIRAGYPYYVCLNNLAPVSWP